MDILKIQRKTDCVVDVIFSGCFYTKSAREKNLKLTVKKIQTLDIPITISTTIPTARQYTNIFLSSSLADGKGKADVALERNVECFEVDTVVFVLAVAVMIAVVLVGSVE